jgi:glycosyltransferase involved in cell wall biosynthesis
VIRVANVLTAGAFGGPQRRILQVAVRLRDQGVETTVLLPSHDSDEFYGRLLDAAVPAVRLPIHRVTRNKRHLAGWFGLFGPELAVLAAAIRKARADVVHCNGVWGVKPVLAGRLAGARVALHLNDTATPPSIQALYHALAPRCHGFIYAGHRSREVYSAVRAFPDAPSRIIPAPVDTAIFDPDTVDPDPTIRGDEGTLQVVTAGTLNPSKGLEYFVEMVRLLCERRDDLRFHVVGQELDTQPEYTARVKANAARVPGGRLTFHGSSANMPGVLAAADIYVCSSIAEASPMAVWESMAMGCALVSTDVGDVNRHLVDGESGLMVPIEDAAALAEGVERLADDPDSRATFGRAARAAVLANLDLSACVRRHREFYELLTRS